MLNIDKEELSLRFRQSDWDYVFKKAYMISEYLIVQNYKITDDDIKNDMAQECCLNLYKKVLDNKVDGTKNIFSFIWANSNFRILEILRKERKRKEKVSFVSYDNILDKILGEEEADEEFTT